jgi:hypothetical protein
LSYEVKPHVETTKFTHQTDYSGQRQALLDKGFVKKQETKVDVSTQPGTLSNSDASAMDGSDASAMDAGSINNPEKPNASPVKEEPMESTRFAALAKREQALRHQTKDLQEREAKIKELETKNQSAKALADKLASNPLEALTEAGISIDALLEKIANGPAASSETSKLEEKIRALEARLETGEKTQAEKQSQTYEAAIKQLKDDVVKLVSTDDNFETIKALGQEDAVVDLIKTTWEKEQRLLSVTDASKVIEEQLDAEASKLLNVKKFRSKFGSTEVPSETLPQATNSTQLASKILEQRSATTLTNQAATHQRPLSPMERARLAFQGQLHK